MTEKQRLIRELTLQFPFFDDDFAWELGRSLSEANLKRLIERLDNARMNALRDFCRVLKCATEAGRKQVIDEYANAPNT